jgi:hypothetical protein
MLTENGLPVTVVGVPVIAPVLELIENPEGNPVADHVMGAVPPVEANAAEYAMLRMELGSATVEIAN